MDTDETARALRIAGTSDIRMPGDFANWLRLHRPTVSVAGLVAFAGPTTFFVGAVSVMGNPDAASVLSLAVLFAIYAGLLWLLLLIAGYTLYCAAPRTASARAALAFLLACLAVAVADTATAPYRGTINLAHGVVTSRQTMQLYSGTFSLAMSLLFFAHLERSRAHEASARRLVSAQLAQRRLRRRAAEARLKALQARIDPTLLFDMLDAVRRCYETDPERAERSLDELVVFLRAALPRLNRASSNVARECELACSYVRLRHLLHGTGGSIDVRIAPDIAHATFPPGVLVPLIDDMRTASPGTVGLVAVRAPPYCTLVVRLPERPSDGALVRVRALLHDLYGASSAVTCVSGARGDTEVRISIPFEEV